MFNAETFNVGEVAQFIYHGKARLGTVDKVEQNYVCVNVKGNDADPAAIFKSFSYNKMNKVDAIVVVE